MQYDPQNGLSRLEIVSLRSGEPLAWAHPKIVVLVMLFKALQLRSHG
jgi:hypothetical protein